jgi:hypothetical protein
MSSQYPLLFTVCAVVGMSALTVTVIAAPAAIIAAIWNHDTVAKVAFTATILGITFFSIALMVTPRIA